MGQLTLGETCVEVDGRSIALGSILGIRRFGPAVAIVHGSPAQTIAVTLASKQEALEKSRALSARSGVRVLDMAIVLWLTAAVIAVFFWAVVSLNSPTSTDSTDSSYDSGSTSSSSGSGGSSSYGSGSSSSYGSDSDYDTDGNGRVDYDKNPDGSVRDYTSDPAQQDELDREVQDFLESKGIDPDAPADDPSQW